MALFERIVDKSLLVRRVNIVAGGVIPRESVQEERFVQMDLFQDSTQLDEETNTLKKEHNLQKVMLDIKKQYGKNAVLKGVNLEEGATTIDRNKQIGGHKA